MGYAASDALDKELRFHAVDILIKLLEHELDSGEESAKVEIIMRCVQHFPVICSCSIAK